MKENAWLGTLPKARGERKKRQNNNSNTDSDDIDMRIFLKYVTKMPSCCSLFFFRVNAFLCNFFVFHSYFSSQFEISNAV